MKRIALLLCHRAALTALLLLLLPGTLLAGGLHLVFVSDSHYGLYRTFRGQRHVGADSVNRALLTAINRLPQTTLPADGGVEAGQKMGYVDVVVNGGDIANRMEQGVQTAAASWQQFAADWCGGYLHVSDAAGQPATLCLLPGNHDVSNAIGYPQPLRPATDATCLAEIYNRTMHPDTPRTAQTCRYATDRVDYLLTRQGVTLMFVGLWPDSRARRWMAQELQRLPENQPVLLFTHDQPEVEAKHLINPNGRHDLNPTDGFENLLADTSDVKDRHDAPRRARRQLAEFLLAHRQIKAYFHGNENYEEAYTWTLPDGRTRLPVFRVDSPMKGEVSGTDETQLSFVVVTLDAEARQMTVRPCYWNAGPDLRWGKPTTVSLR